MLPGHWTLLSSQPLAIFAFEAQPEGEEMKIGAPLYMRSSLGLSSLSEVVAQQAQIPFFAYGNFNLHL